jgi:hypothetical protein
MGLSLNNLLWYGDEGEDMVIVSGAKHGCTLPTKIKVCFNALEISQFTFKQKV